MLEFSNLSKSFAGRNVIRHATGNLQAGTCALQGPNGSGKSTLLSLFAGALAADAGEILIDGLSLSDAPVAARMKLSYAPDESPVYGFITGSDLLELVEKAKRDSVTKKTLAFAKELGLMQYMSIRFSDMSLGTQKKFLLCAAWIGDPLVVLLDEPSNGLDDASRVVLSRKIREQSSHGLTLFVSHDTAFINACDARTVQIGEWVTNQADAHA
jgi:ABC-2 type transport system ATP-binding protein